MGPATTTSGRTQATLDSEADITQIRGSHDVTATDGCCRLLPPEDQKDRFLRKEPVFDLRGRYWDRTSDLFGVNEALSR